MNVLVSPEGDLEHWSPIDGKLQVVQLYLLAFTTDSLIVATSFQSPKLLGAFPWAVLVYLIHGSVS